MVSLIEEAEQLIRHYESTMKPEQFEIIKNSIQETGHRKGMAMQAARLVLVDGHTKKSACELTGANRGSLNRLITTIGAYKVCKHCQRAHKSKSVQTPISGA